MPCFRQEDESGIMCRYEGTQFLNCARISCPSTVPNDSTHCSYSIFLFSSNFRSSLVWFLLEKQFLIATLDHGVGWAEPLAGSPWSPQPRSSETTDQKTSLTIWFQTNLLQDVPESIRVRTEDVAQDASPADVRKSTIDQGHGRSRSLETCYNYLICSYEHSGWVGRGAATCDALL